MTYVALARTQPVQGDAAAHLAGADKALSSAADLLAQILAFIQLDTGRMPYAIKPAALAEILTEAACEFEPRCKAAGVVLRNATTSAWVESDATHLSRVVRNYLSNALEHARARRILVGVRRRGRMARITVADDGRGIPEASHEAIFEDFARVARDGEPAGAGIGLGLAIVRRTARLLGHAYGVMSKPGCGSLFWVEAPFCRAPPTVDSTVQSRRTASLRVLVIEDSAPTAHGLSLLLGAFGHDVRYAHGAEEAVSAIGAWRPDAILADYRLKGEETGVDAIETIRKTLAEDLPAIIITGEGSPHVMAAIDKIGAPVLHKPVAPAVLRAALQHIAAPD